jgi:hypothetical protein
MNSTDFTNTPLFTMATRKVKILIHTPNSQGTTTNLEFYDDCPTRLCTDNSGDSNHKRLFTEYATAIVHKHLAEVEAATTKECMICNGTRKTVLQTPMSYLNKPEPFILSICSPVCEKGKCELEARQGINEMLAEAMGEPNAQNMSAEVTPCGNCGNTEAKKKCNRCMVIAYCNKNCQTAHWPLHKRMCGRKK